MYHFILPLLGPIRRYCIILRLIIFFIIYWNNKYFILYQHFWFSALRFWGKLNESFRLENASNLTHGLCMTILAKRFSKIFLFKLSYNVHLFLFKNEALRSKSFKNNTNNIKLSCWYNLWLNKLKLSSTFVLKMKRCIFNLLF